jgi:sucrose PTS system EIIBCA or EIIBC component
MTREELIAQKLLQHLGGRANVHEIEVCMTRLRVDPRDLGKINQAAIKKVEGVKGVIQTGGQVQIILGPGLAQKVADATATVAEAAPTGSEAPATQSPAPARRGGTKDLLRKIASVFVPLLPALIGAGMIIALNNTLQKLGVINADTRLMGYPVVVVLTILGNTIMGYLSILVGMNAAKEWGGPAAIGAVAGAILIAADLSKMNMTPGRGGLIGALIAGAFLGWLYKQISRHMPDTINIIVTPMLAMLFGGLIVLFAIQPVGFYLSLWITQGANWLLSLGGPVAGVVLGGLFLPLVMLGIHQGLTPIHMEMIKATGVTPLLPVLAMAGAGQVGAAAAVYFKTKDKDLKAVITAAMPVGILGIGEPLIYGVTLPLFRPFIGACIGAAAGGGVIAAFQVGASAIGVSGVLLTLLVNKVTPYLLGLLVSYVVGFAATWVLGFDESTMDESQSFNFGD